MDTEQRPVVALQDFLGVEHRTPESITTMEKPTGLFPPTSVPNRSSPPIAMSLKTRESSSMSLKHIFEQINSSAGRSAQPFDPRLRQAMQLLERKGEDGTRRGFSANEAEQSSAGKPSSEPATTDPALKQTKGMRSQWKQTQEGGELLSLGGLVDAKGNEQKNRGEVSSGRSSSQLSDETASSFEKSPLRRSGQLTGFQSLNHLSTHVTELDLSFQRGQFQESSAFLSQQVAFGSPIPMSTVKRSVSSQQDAPPLHPTPAYWPMLPVLDGAQWTAAGSNACRPNASAKPPIAQLTIFYNGTVNVYDSVPADKAHAIMLLAGSGNPWASHLCHDKPANDNSSPIISREQTPAPSCPGTTSTTRPVMAYAPSSPLSVPTFVFASSAPMSSSAVATEIKQQQAHKRSHTSDLPVARKASLARFLERRRDRVQAQVCNKEMEDGCNQKDEVGSLRSDAPSSPKRQCIRSRSSSPAASFVTKQSPSPIPVTPSGEV